jgi:fructose transport system substrate-binding protein
VKVTIAGRHRRTATRQGQVQAIEDAIARGDSGILITPNGPGVNPAIKKARDAGLYVIALDTPPDPANTVDITFATDNFKAGELIGKWTAAALAASRPTIALLDLFNDKIVSVDYNRGPGLPDRHGHRHKDKKKNGDEAKSGSYSAAAPTASSATSRPTAPRTAAVPPMERCLHQEPGVNVVYTINEPAPVGAQKALKAAGSQNRSVISIDGGCDGVQQVKDGLINATSQQYPLKMASSASRRSRTIATGGPKPSGHQRAWTSTTPASRW